MDDASQATPSKEWSVTISLSNMVGALPFVLLAFAAFYFFYQHRVLDLQSQIMEMNSALSLAVQKQAFLEDRAKYWESEERLREHTIIEDGIRILDLQLANFKSARRH